MGDRSNKITDKMEKHGLTKRVNDVFERVIHKVAHALIEEGFGILTEFQETKTFKKRKEKNSRKYKILGVLDPRPEDIDCITLPCQVLVQESEGHTKVSTIDPVILIRSTKNSNFKKFAQYVRKKLQKVMNKL